MMINKYGRVAGSIDLAVLADMYAQCDDDDLRAHYREVAAESGVDLDSTGPVDALGAVEEVERLSRVAESEDQPPPRAGAGSGRDVWAAYAESKGVEVTDDMTRDEIIEAVEEA